MGIIGKGAGPPENWTLPPNVTSFPEYDATVVGIEFFFVPVFALFGIPGNAFSCATFSTKPLNKYSSSFLLTVKNLSDIGLLATLFLIWASSVFDLDFSQIFPVCQVFIFLSYVFGCLSAWLISLVALETYVRLSKPLCVKIICRRRKAKCITAFMTVVIVCGYSFPFWTGGPDCLPNDSFREFISIMVYVDSALTMFAPCAIVMMTCVAVFMAYIQSYQRHRKLSSFSSESYGRVKQATIMHFVVTVTFILLNLPLHVSRICLMDLHAIDTVNISRTESAFQTISLLLYYFSLAMNFVIYYAFGSRFRASFNEHIKRKERQNIQAIRINRKPSIPPLIVRRKFCTFASGNGNNFNKTYFPGMRQANDV
ncbi:hypothetical protein DPMN_133360 [Dreissena polymorpha]|uniref:G-protein coupled receptors family 1 profile domain-containing protein n=1 Tax=Dreissena polymorpha TaxID=45954 RepID=A0A9D4FXR1_DREPO|nr:hypothetical protein DPMN_133360 [Dreissena polymorpha]